MISQYFIGVNDVLSSARAYLDAGLSVIPVRTDGSKAPRFRHWREFSGRRPTAPELSGWFAAARAGVGVGVTGGPASGNLVVLDFEEWGVFARWGGVLAAGERDRLARCPVVRTPAGGAHVYCRLAESLPGAKYAKDADGECLIETRGDGQFVVAPGSPDSCHPSGRPYQLLRPGWLDGGPFEPVPLADFHTLTVHAAELNEYVRPVYCLPLREQGHAVDRRAGRPDGGRPRRRAVAHVARGGRPVRRGPHRGRRSRIHVRPAHLPHPHRKPPRQRARRRPAQEPGRVTPPAEWHRPGVPRH
jgi:hypothetical protein